MTLSPLSNKRIILGVTGSIASYKAAALASRLAQSGAQVETILTEGAQKFVTPLTFQSVSGRRAFTDGDLWGRDAHVLHVGLGHAAELLIIAPATATTIAKLAQGIADNLLTVTALAAECPLLLAPAMDGGMFTHPATQANLATLRQRGAAIIGPEEGHLASGLVAKGRMSEPDAICGQARYLLSRGGPLAGKKVVVTAGGTREAIDPVRFLTNHSSGRQGFALAQAALDAGANVTLITTAALPTPTGATRIDVISAVEMLDAVLAACSDADVLLMAAAVADFRPAAVAEQKRKKRDGFESIPLTPNPDILVTLAAERKRTGFPTYVVGFAAETQDLLTNAQEKLDRKGLDLVVANDVSAADAGFGVSTNRVTILSKDAPPQRLDLMSKAEVAADVLHRVMQNMATSF